MVKIRDKFLYILTDPSPAGFVKQSIEAIRSRSSVVPRLLYNTVYFLHVRSCVGKREFITNLILRVCTCILLQLNFSIY